MELQVGVKIFLRNSDGKYLLLKRSPEKYPEIDNRWDIVGGRIDPGTVLILNLRREIKEETGLDFTDEPKILAAQDILRIPGRHVIRLTYVGNITGDPVLNEEHTEFGWFGAHEIKNMEGLNIYTKEVVDKKL